MKHTWTLQAQQFCCSSIAPRHQTIGNVCILISSNIFNHIQHPIFSIKRCYLSTEDLAKYREGHGKFVALLVWHLGHQDKTWWIKKSTKGKTEEEKMTIIASSIDHQDRFSLFCPSISYWVMLWKLELCFFYKILEWFLTYKIYLLSVDKYKLSIMSKYIRNVSRNPVTKVNLSRERFMYPQSVPNCCQERTFS